MTKKDYIKIAKILKTTDLEAHKRASLAISFAQICKDDNPNFNIQRFLEACGKLSEAKTIEYHSSVEANKRLLVEEEKFIEDMIKIARNFFLFFFKHFAKFMNL